MVPPCPPSPIQMLSSPSGQTSYGWEYGMGISYSTIFPVLGSNLPSLPELNKPYQTVPLESTLRRRITHGCVNGRYSVHFSVAGLKWEILPARNSASQIVSSLSTTTPYGEEFGVGGA